MAHSWKAVDRHDQLRLGLVSLQELKWHRIVEEVGAIWLGDV